MDHAEMDHASTPRTTLVPGPRSSTSTSSKALLCSGGQVARPQGPPWRSRRCPPGARQHRYPKVQLLELEGRSDIERTPSCHVKIGDVEADGQICGGLWGTDRCSRVSSSSPLILHGVLRKHEGVNLVPTLASSRRASQRWRPWSCTSAATWLREVLAEPPQMDLLVVGGGEELVKWENEGGEEWGTIAAATVGKERDQRVWLQAAALELGGGGRFW